MIRLVIKLEKAVAEHFSLCINKCPFKKDAMIGSIVCKSCEYCYTHSETFVFCVYDERSWYELPEELFVI